MSNSVKKLKITGPILITAIYFVFGFLWILLSDTLLYRLFPEPGIYNRLQTVKGWIYVALTTGLVYFLVGIYASKKNRSIMAAQIAEETAVESLRSKELLVREIHHRTKNNLQLIKSLLKLSLDQGRCSEDGLMSDISRRIDSIALIHEQIYATDSLKQVAMAPYLEALAERIGSLAPNVQVRIDVEELELEMEKAILCGIIVNEIATNSLKYAFPQDDHGERRGKEPEAEVVISLVDRNGKRELMVADNGIGFSKEAPKSSFGLHLTELLSEQLHGEMQLESGSAGTRFRLRF